MNEYISAARVKYLDYSFKHSDGEIELNMINNNRFGLPRPIQNSLAVMDKYIYISLAERERNKWQEHEGMFYFSGFARDLWYFKTIH